MDQKTRQECLQKINEILKNMTNIRKDLKESNKTYFIELVGTPKSGKTTLLSRLTNIFNKSNIPIVPRQETAEYNILPKTSGQYNTWMIMELYKNLCEDMECNHGKIVVYDRGILDRLPWINKSARNNKTTDKDAEIFKKMYNLTLSDNYKPIVYSFKTSPELSVKRKGSPGVSVNVDSLTQFNECLDESTDFLKKHSSIYNNFETDGYQGELDKFTIDVIHSITEDLCTLLSQEKDIKEERDGEQK